MTDKDNNILKIGSKRPSITKTILKENKVERLLQPTFETDLKL